MTLLQFQASWGFQVKLLEDLKGGYNMVGLSQGALIARGVIQWCEDSPQVLNLDKLLSY